MRRSLFIGSLGVFSVMLLASSTAVAGDNWVGTWKLNLAKSKFSPGPAPKALTLKFEATPEGIKLSSEGVNAEGQATKGGYSSKFDGKEVAVAGNANADTAAPKKINDNTYENPWKKAGKA